MLTILNPCVTHGESHGNAIPPKAPDKEIHRAKMYIESKFGPEFLASLLLEDSGQVWQDGVYSGVFVEFAFKPIEQPGVVGHILLEAKLGGQFFAIGGGDLPDCVEEPSRCRISISENEAIDIARAAGLESETNLYFTRLGVFEGFSGFAWRINANTGKTGKHRVLLVNASTGEIEWDYEAFSCG